MTKQLIKTKLSLTLLPNATDLHMDIRQLYEYLKRGKSSNQISKLNFSINGYQKKLVVVLAHTKINNKNGLAVISLERNYISYILHHSSLTRPKNL